MSFDAPLAVVGPTATGKTVLAVALARRLGAELVNADSRQLIRRLRVGTAAPTETELRGIPCHLLDVTEPGAPYSVADWLRAARAILADLAARRVPAILVGGTGQYLRALREGWDLSAPAPDPATRLELSVISERPDGLEVLVAELRDRDPEGAASLDLANPRRVIRAVEQLRGGALSLREARQRAGGITVDTVVLDADRAVHRAAIEHRIETMFVSGALVAEVESELQRGTTPEALRRAGIGYGEALDLIAGGSRFDQACASALRRTQRYVKAQRTWFRHEPSLLRLERGATTLTTGLEDAVVTAIRSPRAGPRRGSRR